MARRRQRKRRVKRRRTQKGRGLKRFIPKRRNRMRGGFFYPWIPDVKPQDIRF